MSLLPAALAADAAGSTALTNALENAVVPNTVSPSGIQLNLFDYWVGTRTSTDTNTKYASVKDSGINKDHYLKFNSGGPMSVGANNINQWTGYSGKVFSGIVQDQLSGGYPVLSTGKVYGANSSETVGSQSGWVTSLAYLFDQSQQIDAADEGGTSTGIVGKRPIGMSTASCKSTAAAITITMPIRIMLTPANMRAQTIPASTKRQTPSRSTTSRASPPAAAPAFRASSSPSPTRRLSSRWTATRI